jgi:hypothetical protein
MRVIFDGSSYLIGASSANHDLGSPTIRAREGKQDTAAGVGIRTMVSREVGQGFDDGVALYVEDLRGFVREDEKLTVLEKMHEGIHVVWLIIGQNVHLDAPARADTGGRQNLIRGIVVGWHRRVPRTISKSTDQCSDQFRRTA